MASNVADGLTLARNEDFDLCLIDRWPPDGEGIELCRSIRTFDVNTPIVFLSADAREATRAKAIAEVHKVIWSSPVSPGLLEEIIAMLIRKMKSQTAR